MPTGTKTKKPLNETAKARLQRHKMKLRAAILSIVPLGDKTYRVWGGESPHIVRVLEDGRILCDCEGWKKARGHNCSHCMKYRLTYGDLKK